MSQPESKAMNEGGDIAQEAPVEVAATTPIRATPVWKRWRLWAVVASVVVLGVAAVPVSRGLMVAHAKKFQVGGNDSIKWLQRADGLGSPEAPYLMAQIMDPKGYPFTPGITVGGKDAFAWYTKAADRGFAPAQARLGFLYSKGLEVKQDPQKAAGLAKQAAAANDPDGLNLLATLYMEGTGVEKDVNKGVDLHKQAAGRGNTGSMLALSALYAVGGVTPCTPVEAHRYLGMLVDAGDPTGLLLMGLAYEHGDALVPKDEGKALELYLRGAKKGNAKCEYHLARLLAYGAGSVQANPPEAMKWLRASAEAGYAQAEYLLGMALGEGKWLPMDFVQSLAWIRKAAEGGASGAQTKLGSFYLRGFLVEQNASEAYDWLSRAAEAGDPEARNLLPQAEAAKARADNPVEVTGLGVTYEGPVPYVTGEVHNTSSRRVIVTVHVKVLDFTGAVIDNMQPTVVLDGGDRGRIRAPGWQSWRGPRIVLQGVQVQ